MEIQPVPYDDFITYAHKYQFGLETNRKELKRKLWKALINVNILEGIRFYASFACTFAFGELRLMEGSAKIISFIARDESQHLSITQHIIKNYKSNENDEEMLEVIEEEKTVHFRVQHWSVPRDLARVVSVFWMPALGEKIAESAAAKCE